MLLTLDTTERPLELFEANFLPHEEQRSQEPRTLEPMLASFLPSALDMAGELQVHCPAISGASTTWRDSPTC